MQLNKFLIFLCALSPICGINVSGKATLEKPAEKLVVATTVEHQKQSAELIADKGYPVPQGIRPKFNAMAAEFIAMSMYIFVGCGTLMGVAREGNSAWNLHIALTFAMTFASLSYAISHYSGAQINPAITLALVFTGRITIAQGILNFIFQLFGCIAGSLLLLFIYPGTLDQNMIMGTSTQATDASQEETGTTKEAADKTGDLGLNQICEGWGNDWQSITKVAVYEALMSFGLCFTVLETATNPMAWANSTMAPAAIAGVVFLAHAVLLPIDGCSINPARSFGPAVVVKCFQIAREKGHIKSDRFTGKDPFKNHWVFWTGPMVGGLVAAGISASFMP